MNDGLTFARWPYNNRVSPLYKNEREKLNFQTIKVIALLIRKI